LYAGLPICAPVFLRLGILGGILGHGDARPGAPVSEEKHNPDTDFDDAGGGVGEREDNITGQIENSAAPLNHLFSCKSGDFPGPVAGGGIQNTRRAG
jgi:hypothetical protein